MSKFFPGTIGSQAPIQIFPPSSNKNISAVSEHIVLYDNSALTKYNAFIVSVIDPIDYSYIHTLIRKAPSHNNLSGGVGSIVYNKYSNYGMTKGVDKVIVTETTDVITDPGIIIVNLTPSTVRIIAFYTYKFATEYRSMVTYSDDGGDTWSSEVKVTEDYGPGDAFVTVSSGIVEDNTGVLFKTAWSKLPSPGESFTSGVLYKSIDKGVTWTFVSQITTRNNPKSYEEQGIFQGGNVLYFTNRSDVDNSCTICYSLDHGLTISAPKFCFSSIGRNGMAISPSGIILGIGRDPVTKRTILAFTKDFWDTSTVTFADGYLRDYEYGEVMWHPTLKKFIALYCGIVNLGTTVSGPTIVIRRVYNELGESVPSLIITTDAIDRSLAPFTATFTFSESVTGFALGDISVTNGVASSLNTSDNIIFTATITPTAAKTTGMLSLYVNDNVCVNGLGVFNIKSNVIELNFNKLVPFGLASDCVFYLPTHRVNNMQKESVDTLTNPHSAPANGDFITFMMAENSPIKLKTTSTAPLFDTTQGRCGILFNRSLSKRLRFVNTIKFFRNLHSDTIAFGGFVKLASNNQGMIINSDGVGAGKSGWEVYLSSAGKLGFFEQVGGVTKHNVLSSNSITTASGYIFFMVEKNGVGTNTGRLILGATTTLFNVVTVTATDQSQDLHIGGFADATLNWFLDGYLSDLWLYKAALSAQDLIDANASNPDLDTETMPTPQDEVDYDFNDTASNWADTARTTSITNTTPVRYTDNIVTSKFGGFNKDLTGASGTSPLWLSNILNGKAVISFDGVDDLLTFTDTTWFPEGGIWTLYFVVKNNQATASELAQGAAASDSSMLLDIGDTWAPYARNQTQSKNILSVKNKNIPQMFNTFALRRVGDQWTGFDGNGVPHYGIVNPDRFLIQQFGLTLTFSAPNKSQIARFKITHGYETDAVVQAKIPVLNTLYNI